MYYLDNAATTFPKPKAVYDKVLEVMTTYYANPGRSGHKLALKASRGIFDTREALQEFFNAKDPLQIILTKNCTESLNLAIKGSLKPNDHVITTSMEHNSVLRPIKYLEQFGVTHTIVNADKEGRINPKDIESAINNKTKLIATTQVSNLTGTIQPFREIGEIARNNGILYLLDAAQGAGVYDIDLKKDNIDLLAFPGHKSLLGPQGTGGLYIKEGLQLQELIQGGTGSASDSIIQPIVFPDRYESGTPDTANVIALKAGIDYINEVGINEIRHHEEKLTSYFIEELSKIKEVTIYGPKSVKEQAAVVSINIKDQDSSTIAYILNEDYDIYVRPGLHCAPLAHKTIGTLKQGTVRFSFGPFTTVEELDYTLTAIKKIVREV